MSTRRVWIARAIGVAADLLQLAVFPAFLAGVLSPVNAVLDVIVAVIMTLLVGWHIAFLPGFVVEMLPFANLAPTWTIAVLIATRGRRAAAPSDRLGLPVPGDEGSPSWRNWYDGLTKPSWTPSPSTIGLIWTILYPIIIVTFGFVFIQAARGKLPWPVMLPFAINLVANLIFTTILFRLRNLTLATFDILIVLGTIVWSMVVIWPHYPLIAVAQVPYLLWVGIATALQVSITLMNSRSSTGA